MMSDVQNRGMCVAMRMILPADINGNGTVFGGAILSEYDLAGATAVRKMLGLAQITTRKLEINFTKPLYPGDIFTIYAKLNHIGNSSVAIDLEGWRTSSENEEECFSTVKVIFVNINERGAPMRIPEWSRERAELMMKNS
jgi:acyl-CoA thioesterase YciA